MIKKNKLSLFLLAAVMMLSIYYINMPSQSEVSTPTGSTNVTTRYHAFAVERLQILEDREEEVAVFTAILTSPTATTEKKDEANADMQKVYKLTEDEILVEKYITDLGYKDCLVTITEDLIMVKVLSDNFTKELSEEVIIMVLTTLNVSTEVFTIGVKEE